VFVEPLVAVLKDPDSHSRWLAAGALSQIKDPRAVSAAFPKACFALASVNFLGIVKLTLPKML
jgi:HEAT repeat protein